MRRTVSVPMIFLTVISFLVLFTAGIIFAGEKMNAANPSVVIHSFSELNQGEGVTDSHAGSTTRSSVEVDFRSKQLLGKDVLGTGTAHYPRMLKFQNGTYMMTYNDGRTGPDVMYITSSDLRTWSVPKTLFASDGTYKYATCDGVVLSDGTVICCASKRTVAWTPYATDPCSGGLVIRTSSDNGATWSEEKLICSGTVWEPSLLQTDTGEIQIYYTNISPYIYMYGYDDEVRSSFSSMVRSTDGGQTWFPDINGANMDESDPFAGWRIMQQLTGYREVTDRNGNTVSVPYYNDQMPVARQLNNGSIAVVVESFDYFNTHPTFGGHYTLSIGFSHDNWATRLGLNDEGPADRLSAVERSAGPYINQFPSGEVLITHTNASTTLELKLGEADAHSFNANTTISLGTKNLWSATCLVDSHRMAAMTDDGNNSAAVEAQTMSVGYAELVLNHNISAKRQYTTMDGNSVDWSENTEALFVGSISQAQASIRSAYDDSYIYFLIEVLDEKLSSSDSVQIDFSPKSDGTTSYNFKVGPNGLVSKSFSGTINVNTYKGGTVGADGDTDTGYIAEVRLARSDLTSLGFTDCLYVLPTLYNTDGSVASAADSITGANIKKSGKPGCPKITYTSYNTYDTVYVSGSGRDSAFGNTPENAVASLPRAFEIVRDGGRVVLISDVTLSSTVSIGNGGSATLTSLHGTETLRMGGSIKANVNLTVEDLPITVTVGDVFLYMQYHDLHIKDSVRCTLSGSNTYVAIQAGFWANNAASAYAQLCSDRDCRIQIDGGTWRYIRGGNRRSGTTAPLGHYSGNSTIVINGGSFMATSEGATIDVSSPSGMNSFSGTNRMIINGGVFKGALYALSRSGGMVKTANGYTATPDYSGEAEIVLTGGTFEKGIYAAQTLGDSSNGISFTSHAVLSLQYANGYENKATTSGFHRLTDIGGYVIPMIEEPLYVDINGQCPSYYVYGEKLYLPSSEVNGRALMVVRTSESTEVYLLEEDGVTVRTLSLGNLLPRYIGTSIRVVPEAGLRFKTQIDSRDIGNGVSLSRVGALAAFSDRLGDRVLTRASEHAGDSVAYDRDASFSHWYEDEEEYQIYTAVLIGFESDEYDREVTYRPYVEISYEGQRYTVYGEAVTRSIYGVARQCVGKDSLYPFVQEIIHSVDGTDSGEVSYDFFS